MVEKQVLLEVSELRKYYPISRGIFRRVAGYVKAVDGVSFSVNQGEVVGLIGESGCGKTTTGRCILRAITPTSGSILFHNGKAQDVTAMNRDELRDYRRNAQMIFQDPYSSLNPRMSVLEIVGEALYVNGVARGRALEDRVRVLMSQVGLKPEHMRRFPHAFSGGQRQRIGIARALALEPKLIVADEPTSALDVSIQAQIINLLQNLQKTLGLTYLLIAHDLSVIRHFSNRVVVLYVGQACEVSDTEELFRAPRHPYTEALLSAVPKPDPKRRGNRIVLGGEVPDPAAAPLGCKFHPRCPYSQEVCRTELPPMIEVSEDHFASCHFSETLKLRAV